MSDDVSTHSFSVPLDDDDFLRRECPQCEREFKWRYSEEESEPVPDSGYFCPYCGAQSDADSFWTKAQLERAKSVAATEAVDPMMEEFMSEMDRKHGFSMTYEKGERIGELPDEPNDMRRVDFECHALEPLKVDEAWTGEVHCLVCGAKA